MAEAYPPLLPWKLLAGLLAILAALSGWTLNWDPFGEAILRNDPMEGLPPRRHPGDGVVFIGNSKLVFALTPYSTAHEVLEAARLEGYEAGIIGGSWFIIDTLEPKTQRLVSWRPTLLVVLVDTFAPGVVDVDLKLGVEGRERFERDGRRFEIARRVFDQVPAARRIAFEVPHSETYATALSPAWFADRAALHERLRGEGWAVVVDPEPWPAANFSDDHHLSGTGSARFRRWLGEEIARVLAEEQVDR